MHLQHGEPFTPYPTAQVSSLDCCMSQKTRRQDQARSRYQTGISCAYTLLFSNHTSRNRRPNDRERRRRRCRSHKAPPARRSNSPDPQTRSAPGGRDRFRPAGTSRRRPTAPRQGMPQTPLPRSRLPPEGATPSCLASAPSCARPRTGYRTTGTGRRGRSCATGHRTKPPAPDIPPARTSGADRGCAARTSWPPDPSAPPSAPAVSGGSRVRLYGALFERSVAVG